MPGTDRLRAVDIDDLWLQRGSLPSQANAAHAGKKGAGKEG